MYMIMRVSVLPDIWILLETFILGYYFFNFSLSLISAWDNAVCTWNHLKWLKGLRGGYFRNIGISEDMFFSVDVWSLQSVAMIREKHFLWNSSLQEHSGLRWARCWFRSSRLEAVLTEGVQGGPGVWKVYLQFTIRKYKVTLILTQV